MRVMRVKQPGTSLLPSPFSSSSYYIITAAFLSWILLLAKCNQLHFDARLTGGWKLLGICIFNSFLSEFRSRKLKQGQGQYYLPWNWRGLAVVNSLEGLSILLHPPSLPTSPLSPSLSCMSQVPLFSSLPQPKSMANSIDSPLTRRERESWPVGYLRFFYSWFLLLWKGFFFRFNSRFAHFHFFPKVFHGFSSVWLYILLKISVFKWLKGKKFSHLPLVTDISEVLTGR